MSDTISINENKTPDNGEKGELKGFAKFLNFLKSYFSKPSNIIFDNICHSSYVNSCYSTCIPFI